MGGYGITEDCPGFLANKWMDAQLEATYEGPEAVQRRQLTVTMTNEVFLAQFRAWTARCARIASHASRHRRLHAGLGHADVALDAQSPAERHRRRRQQALPRAAPGRDLPAGRRALLAAGLALPDSRRARTRSTRRRRCRRRRRPRRAQCSSSATFATPRPRRPPAKSRASAPSWSSATTAIPPGTRKATRNCFLASELEELEETMPGISRLGRGCDRRPTAAIRRRPARARVAPAQRVPAPADQALPPASPARASPKIAPPKR